MTQHSFATQLSLHTEFQSHSTSPTIKLFMALNKNNKNNKDNKNKKVTENSGNFVSPLLRKGDQSFSLRAPCQGKRRARANIQQIQYHIDFTIGTDSSIHLNLYRKCFSEIIFTEQKNQSGANMLFHTMHLNLSATESRFHGYCPIFAQYLPLSLIHI